MTDISPQTASLTDRVRPVTGAQECAVLAVHFLGATAAFVLAEEAVLLAGADGAANRVAITEGGILAAASDGHRLITGGDDGRVLALTADGRIDEIARDAKNRWIDQVAIGPSGAVAWSAGKSVFVRTDKGEVKTLDLASSAGGLAFAPKGMRLAIARYSGVTLWFPNASAAPENLDWKGSHLGVAFSPDGKFIVTSMQEPTLHGWRLADARNMRMSGYATKVRSFAWTADGDALATSGANQVILWPFAGKDGPMGKTPRMLAPRDVRVAAVACHPAQGVAAAGFADGMVLLVRLSDGAEILVRSPDGAEVTALAFSPRGDALGFGTASGAAGLLAI